MALIYWVSSRPRPEAFDDTPDAVLHAAAYFLMGILAIRACSRGLGHRPTRAALVGGAAIALAYGASDEIHQSFVPGRVGSVSEFVYDGVGAALAAAALSVFWRVRQ